MPLCFDIAGLVCLDAIKRERQETVGMIQIFILCYNLRRAFSRCVDQIGQVAPDGFITGRLPVEASFRGDVVCNMRVLPRIGHCVIHPLAKIYTCDTMPILAWDQMNPAGREEHTEQPRGLRHLLLGCYFIRIAPQDWRTVQWQLDPVPSKHAKYQSLEQILPLNQGKPRRRTIDIGRVPLGSCRAENLRREHHPQRLARCIGRIPAFVIKMDVIVPVWDRIIQDRNRFWLSIPIFLICGL